MVFSSDWQFNMLNYFSVGDKRSEEDNWGQRSEWDRLLSMALVSDQEGLGAGFASYLWPDMKQGTWSF